MAEDMTRRYELLALLGSGGFGTVYRARFQGEGGFSKEVALKMLNPSAEASAEIVQRLRDEARLLGLLRHRAIVQVDRLTRIDDRWTVIMEYVDGVDLATVVRAGRVPTGAALEITAEIAGALHAAWTWPIDGTPLRAIHRDIKPSNLRLTRFGELKLLDFGIARAEFAAREAHTRSVHFGSPEYMAPERLAFEGDGPSGDVYAIGAVLYEMLAAEPLGRSSPLPSRHATRLEAVQARLQAMGDLPEAVIALVLQTLDGDPERRPSAGQLERSALELREKIGGEALRFWASRVVPTLGGSQPLDPRLSGTILVEAEVDAPRSSETWGGQSGELPQERAPAGGPTLAPTPSSLSGIALRQAARLSWWGGDPPHAARFPLAPLPTERVGPHARHTPSQLQGQTQATQPRQPTLSEPVADPEPAPQPRRKSMWIAAFVAAGLALAAVVLRPDPAPPLAGEPAAPAPTEEPAAAPQPTAPPAPVEAPPEATTPPPTERARSPRSTPPAASPTPLPAQDRPARVGLQGDATGVELVSGSTTLSLPGEVPAGTYTIRARFGDAPAAGAGTLSVSAGESLTLVCKAGFDLCNTLR